MVGEGLHALARYVQLKATWHRLGDGITSSDFLRELRTAKQHAAVPRRLPQLEVELGNGETVALTVAETTPLRFVVEPPPAFSDPGGTAPPEVIAVRAV